MSTIKNLTFVEFSKITDLHGKKVWTFSLKTDSGAEITVSDIYTWTVNEETGGITFFADNSYLKLQFFRSDICVASIRVTDRGYNQYTLGFTGGSDFTCRMREEAKLYLLTKLAKFESEKPTFLGNIASNVGQASDYVTGLGTYALGGVVQLGQNLFDYGQAGLTRVGRGISGAIGAVQDYRSRLSAEEQQRNNERLAQERRLAEQGVRQAAARASALLQQRQDTLSQQVTNLTTVLAAQAARTQVVEQDRDQMFRNVQLQRSRSRSRPRGAPF